MNSSRPRAAAKRWTERRRSRRTNPLVSSRWSIFCTVAYCELAPPGVQDVGDLPRRTCPAVPEDLQDFQFARRDIGGYVSHRNRGLLSSLVSIQSQLVINLSLLVLVP